MENDKTKNKSNDIPTMGVSQCSLPSLRGRGRGRGWFGDTLPSSFISYSLSLPLKSVSAVLTLLDEGCTIPFISRYRKERTGNLDEVQITNISELNDRLKELGKRKETILKTVREQEKLTPELEAKIHACMDSSELEDIYLPYKPKRRTRAQIAREQGLEPLALAIMKGASPNPSERRGEAPPNLPERGGVPIRTQKGEYSTLPHTSQQRTCKFVSPPFGGVGGGFSYIPLAFSNPFVSGALRPVKSEKICIKSRVLPRERIFWRKSSPTLRVSAP